MRSETGAVYRRSCEYPLVSAIMPTRARPQFAREAVNLFLAQTWPNKELVIVDDEDAPSIPGPLSVAYTLNMENVNFRYERLRTKQSIGAKRNIACSRAQGEIIIHFDDDDHSAPGRMADQVERLLSSGLELTGYSEMLFFDGNVWRMYSGRKDYILGTSFCYRKSLWERHPFTWANIGEDLAFQRGIPHTAVPAGSLMWARTHPGNTSKRVISGPTWREAELQTAAFLHDERASG